MFKKLFAIGALLLAVPASAEFTPEEKTQALNQIKAVHDAAKGAYYAGLYLTPHHEAVAEIHAITTSILAAREKHSGGILYLLDMDGATSNTISNMTRAQALAAGVERIGSAEASYAPAIAQIQALLNACSSSCSNLTTAKNELTAAEGFRTSFNAGLPYEDPRVAENAAFPGATREESANAGPHGDYRRFGRMTQNRESSIRQKWMFDMSAALKNPAYIPRYVTNLSHHDRTARFNVIGLGLMAGLEHPAVVGDLNVMEAGGTTQRSRHFFRVLLMQEMFIGLDHLNNPVYNYSRDVFGRIVFRGNTYQLQRQIRETSIFLCADTSIPEWACDAIQSMRWAGEEWAEMDDQAWNGLVLRFFTNIGRPPQTSGVCDPATTVMQLVDGKPTCVGTGGTPTCPECPPPPPCPSFQPEMVLIDSTTAQAQCVQVP